MRFSGLNRSNRLSILAFPGLQAAINFIFLLFDERMLGRALLGNYLGNLRVTKRVIWTSLGAFQRGPYPVRPP